MQWRRKSSSRWHIAECVSHWCYVLQRTNGWLRGFAAVQDQYLKEEIDEWQCIIAGMCRVHILCCASWVPLNAYVMLARHWALFHSFKKEDPSELAVTLKDHVSKVSQVPSSGANFQKIVFWIKRRYHVVVLLGLLLLPQISYVANKQFSLAKYSVELWAIPI